MAGRKSKHTFWVFAVLAADLGAFNSVIDGVTNDVGDRVLDRFEQALVELGFLALHLEPDLFSALMGEVPDHAGQL